MNKRLIIKNLSKLMTAEAFLMLLPALVSVIYKEYRIAIIFTLTAAVIFALFLPLSLVIPRGNKIYAKEGFAIVALAWITWSLAGAVPFYISGVIPNYIDCFFETVSGLTTTGATILTEITSLPKGILFWRSFTHWIGGMGGFGFCYGGGALIRKQYEPDACGSAGSHGRKACSERWKICKNSLRNVSCSHAFGNRFPAFGKNAAF